MEFCTDLKHLEARTAAQDLIVELLWYMETGENQERIEKLSDKQKKKFNRKRHTTIELEKQKAQAKKQIEALKDLT